MLIIFLFKGFKYTSVYYQLVLLYKYEILIRNVADNLIYIDMIRMIQCELHGKDSIFINTNLLICLFKFQQI